MAIFYIRKAGEAKRMKDIGTMDEEQLLSDDTFITLLKETNAVKRTRIEIALLDRAKKIGVRTEYESLLKAYKAEYVKSSSKSNNSTVDSVKGDIKEQFHRFKDNKPTSVIDKKISEFIIKKNDIFVFGGIPYIYQNGVYIADDNETKLKAIIQNCIYEDLITIDIVNRIYRLIISQEKLQKNYEELNNYPKRLINFRNGMFDVVEWKLYEHKPEYFSINQISNELPEQEPKGEKIKLFLDYSVPDEADKEMLYQYFGLCMTADSSIQRFLVLTGQAGTGKSILIRIIENIIGKKNISNISLQQLNERFFPSSLLGKTLNSCADIPSKAMDTVDGIKKATGEDNIIYERKGKDAKSFRSYAKLLFSANEIPVNIDEKSEAIYRRMMILRIDRKPKKADAGLWNKIEPEIDYVMYQSLLALRRLYKNGDISVSENSNRSVLELYETADNVLAFINDCLVKDSEGRVKQSELYKDYKQYCDDTGRNPVSVFGFNKNLRNKGYSTVQIHGNTHYMGLGYKEKEFVQVDYENVPFL